MILLDVDPPRLFLDRARFVNPDYCAGFRLSIDGKMYVFGAFLAARSAAIFVVERHPEGHA